MGVVYTEDVSEHLRIIEWNVAVLLGTVNANQAANNGMFNDLAKLRQMLRDLDEVLVNPQHATSSTYADEQSARAQLAAVERIFGNARVFDDCRTVVEKAKVAMKAGAENEQYKITLHNVRCALFLPDAATNEEIFLEALRVARIAAAPKTEPMPDEPPLFEPLDAPMVNVAQPADDDIPF